LTEEFELDSLADKILVERSAMYLVRIMRTEAYEATVGLTEKTAFWGYYISRLDNMLRGLFADLAITRGKRKQLEKGDALLISLDEVIRKFAKNSQKNDEAAETAPVAMREDTFGRMRRSLFVKWKREYPKLASTVRRRRDNGSQNAAAAP
jgi:hypothetical protein